MKSLLARFTKRRSPSPAWLSVVLSPSSSHWCSAASRSSPTSRTARRCSFPFGIEITLPAVLLPHLVIGIGEAALTVPIWRYARSGKVVFMDPRCWLVAHLVAVVATTFVHAPALLAAALALSPSTAAGRDRWRLLKRTLLATSRLQPDGQPRLRAVALWRGDFNPHYLLPEPARAAAGLPRHLVRRRASMSSRPSACRRH